MVTILHGENLVASREKLVELLETAKEKNLTIDRFDAKHLNRAELETKLVKQDLFGSKRLVVIEGLHSLPKSKQKNHLIELLQSATVGLILWEKRDLTKTMLKRFPEAEVHHFKLSNALFNWLDSLRGDKRRLKTQLKKLHQALEREDPYLCFIMLARQLRLLIQLKEGNRPPGAPWMIKKLEKQAQSFSLKQLLQLHQELIRIDHAHKTSTGQLDLTQELDLLLINL